MAIFIDVLAKEYNPGNIDGHMFAMDISAPHCVPIVCTQMIDETQYGRVTVDGIEISKGKCVSFDFSPCPMLFIPVGEVAKEYGKSYQVRLSGFRTKNGGKFIDYSYKLKTPKRPVRDDRYEEREQVAKRVADEGIVLLENNGILPLKKGSPVKLLGAYEDFRISAIGAGAIKPRWKLSLAEALEEENKLRLSHKAEVGIFVISRDSAEGRDNPALPGGYYLTESEKQKLRQAAGSCKSLIVVLSTGYPIEMKYIQSLNPAAVLWSGYSGQRGSESVADILIGAVNPSGRLADTWPLDYYDCPSAKDFINLKEEDIFYSDKGVKFGAKIFYKEGLYVGYRYFDSFHKPVTYSFGHGLSYSSFEVEAKLDYDAAKLQLGVDARVKNIKEVSGKHSVLIYVEPPKGSLEKPRRSLAGFGKTKQLSLGEEEVLNISVPAKDFASFDAERHIFVLEAGEYKVYVGGSTEEACFFGSFVLSEEMVLEEVPSVLPCLEEGESCITAAKEAISIPTAMEKPIWKEVEKQEGALISFEELKRDNGKMDAFVSQFSVKELVDFIVCNGSCYHAGGSGAAGKLARLKRLGIPRFYMSDGNSGLNLFTNTTGFPASNLLAGSFNVNLAYELGKVIAEDSKEHNISINLGPGSNLHRNILCGRHPEYFSEDPILAGIFMANQAKGLEEHGVRATYKHFLANNIEFGRKSAHSIVDERSLHELYLRVFDKALTLYQPSCIMTSYNPVNGAYPCENPLLLQKLLRTCWGFEGMIMTDWGSCDTADAVKTVQAGTNLLTPGDKKLYRKIYKEAKRGEISKGTLQDSVKHILKVLVKCEMGDKE